MDYIDLNDVARMGPPIVAPGEPKRVETDQNTSFRVLVVDDSAVMRRVLHEALLSASYRVETCKDGEEARELIEKDPPHIVVSDWQMPGMSGPDLCRWLRQQKWQEYIYFVMITAHDKSFDIAEGLTCGADDYVQKPIQMSELMARLRNAQRALELHRRLKSPAKLNGALDID
jgi:DNA-binding response OmpR family regulator